MMNFRRFFILAGVLALTACGDASKISRTQPASVEAVASTEALPTYEARGVISSLEGQILTLDHDGASGAGLKAGRDTFKVYADVLAEAPLAPGARVKFQFKKTPTGLELSKLEPRD
ncbi:copper-binding protein [Caulobacter sp. BP25]|uniref:copper-binding protein n=1 Tax=Caulobacter sp. BP25 TaxID=2048900 RepID=UPI000C12ABF9|nr:copper-binding protein [Caulobacter sp. BP25]PHY22240.1 hypothetical protein CSW59_02120 [Caulobacter sp. BP25]